MMEQAHPREAHGNAVFVAGFDDLIVTDTAARFRDIGHTAAARPFDVVTALEERVAGDGQALDA